MDLNPTCPSCHLQILPVFYFCPNCGKSLRTKPLSTSVGKQIGVYALSLLLPPLGLWPGFKYLFQKETKAKIVGVTAISLTIISCIITIYLSFGLIDQIKGQITTQLGNELNNQINNQLPQ